MHISLRRFPAPGRFLLEGVQYINSAVKPHRVDRTVGVASVVLDNFKHSGPSSLPGFCLWVFPPKLGNTQTEADLILDRLRKRPQVFLGRPDPKQRLLTGRAPGSRHLRYPISRIALPPRGAQSSRAVGWRSKRAWGEGADRAGPALALQIRFDPFLDLVAAVVVGIEANSHCPAGGFAPGDVSAHPEAREGEQGEGNLDGLARGDRFRDG